MRTFYYDAENQLTNVTVAGVWKSDFQYDGLLRRRISRDYRWDAGTSSWVKTNEVQYVYDGQLVIQERDANYLPQVTYTRGNDLSGSLQGAGGIGGLLARTSNPQFQSSDPNAHAYYHSDGNGNVTCLINVGNAVVASYSYDPYGNMLAMSGPLADANTYRFSSKEWNGNAGLYYYDFRFYDPNLQRWPNRDPIEERGGPNLYGFVGNNPMNVVDLFGLDCYLIKRQLFPSLLNHTPWPRSRHDFLSHTFALVTNPDGTVKNTYSWGNTHYATSWAVPNRDEDVAAAKQALQMGGNYLHKVGDASLDKFVGDAFKDLKQNEPQHKNGIVDNNCKTEALKLIDRAKELQKQPQEQTQCTGE